MSSTSAVERPHTYDEVRAWRDNTRWERIDGQADAITGPSWQHQSVVARCVVQLLAYFDTQGCRVLPAPLDVRLGEGDEPDDEIETVV